MEEILSHLPVIEKILRQNQVVLALVFGSVAKKRPNRLSDLDLGVVLADSVPNKKYPQTRLALLDKLGRILKKQPLDVIILNQASPLLTQMAISHGKVIFCPEQNLRIQFQIKSLKEFDDAYYLRRAYYHYLEQRVKNNQLGEIAANAS